MTPDVQNSTHNIHGSLWNRWDLHFHTPASYDYENGEVTNQQIVDGLVNAGIRVVAITDHHTMDVERIRELQLLGADQLTVLPGIELRSDQGGPPIHYICIFSEDSDLDDLWTTIQGRLGLTNKNVIAKGGDDKVYVPLEDGARLTQELHGIVSIHAGTKSNSIEGIKNHEQFQQRLKFDITQQWVDIMEVGQIKDVDTHLNKIFPTASFCRPLIICSDNHAINEYQVKAPLWIRADPNFRGLRMTLKEPQERIFIGAQPPSKTRVEQNPTRYIKGIHFHNTADPKNPEKWFDGYIPFNSGLVAIIGNKGSGKSALADILGLLGATRNTSSFSFLNTDRFLHPVRGKAAYYDATLEWCSGESKRRNLADSPRSEEVERIRYLPQEYVEAVCNELEGGSESSFERELKSVIFSHVPDELRLEQATLDDLVRFQTDEKQRRIDSLIVQLKEVSRSRARAELNADANRKKEIQERIRQRETELEAHQTVKPKEIPMPSDAETNNPELSVRLAELKTRRKRLQGLIGDAKAKIRDEELRRAQSARLMERLGNFQKQFEEFRDGLSGEAQALGLNINDLIALKIDKDPIIQIQADSTDEISQTTKSLNDQESNPPGLHAQLQETDEEITELQLQFDAPNRAYQAYQQELEEWEVRRKTIIGSADAADSLEGLKASLAEFENLPARIDALREQQAEVAQKIHEEKSAQAEVYRALYEPVQSFIDNHPLAKAKLKLEFRVELTDAGFQDALLNMIAQNRRGSFMGTDEGRERAEEFAQKSDWENQESVEAFLEEVDNALHFDIRTLQREPVQLKEQLIKGKQPEDVFNLLYGLEYLRPKYILRWDGKELAMLSPGQRGTLLLIFYLLIDKTETPLIIDQPEGNLDNHTVAKVLVECIKDARKRRQVFIVTHNPNLAVVCDADQIIHAEMDIEDGNKVTYTCGALENPIINRCVTDVLEGTRMAFDMRGGKYNVVEP